MVTVPADTPHMVPLVPIVATVVALLLQVPPDVASLSVVHAPTQMLEAPEMADGIGVTVTVAHTAHPVPNE